MSRKKYTIKCKFCSREINPFRRTQIYCSKSCRAKDMDFGKKTGRFVKCSTCGEEIWRKKYLLEKHKNFFCNRNCFYKQIRKIQKYIGNYTIGACMNLCKLIINKIKSKDKD